MSQNAHGPAPLHADGGAFNILVSSRRGSNRADRHRQPQKLMNCIRTAVLSCYAIFILIGFLTMPFANASFVQWSRQFNVSSVDGEDGENHFDGSAPTPLNMVTSATGVHVVANRVRSGGRSLLNIDVLNGRSGEALVKVALNGSLLTALDTFIVIGPERGGVNDDHELRCGGSGSIFGSGSYVWDDNDNANRLWCGVLLLSSTNSAAGASILLPNASLIPLLPPSTSASTALPWNCTVDSPCTILSQEASGEGCHRDFVSYPSGEQRPPLQYAFRSTHVSVVSGDKSGVFMFRPAEVADGATLEVALSRISRSSVVVGEGTTLQNTTIARPVAKSAATVQSVFCALIALSSNGSAVIMDSDSQDERGGYDLPIFSTIPAHRPAGGCR